MTILFLHGLGQTPQDWQSVLSRLPREWDCRCPSLPELLGGKPVCYQEAYGALEEYCNGISGKFCLCGLSLGAELALDYAIHHGQRLHSLVLIAAQYRMPRFLLAMQNVLFRFMPEENFQELGFRKQDFIRLCATTGEQDFSRNLSGISCPALILCGEKDSANRKAALGLSRGIPGSRLIIVPQSGHEVNKDTPEALAEMLRDFWKDAE